MPKTRGKDIKLKRELGLLEATFAGVGIIVGAGIYALLGVAAGVAGNAVWLSFGIASFVALFTGLSYAELSSMFPDDAGEYLYVEKGLNERLGFLSAWMVIFMILFGGAGVAVGFAGYLVELLPGLGISMFAAAAGVVLVFGLVNYWGIKQSARLNIIFTSLEVLGLIGIVILGLKYFGSVDYFHMANGVKGVLSTAALAFWAFIGFESIVKLSEECREPEKTIPKALILSIAITTVLYIFVAAAAVSIVGWEVLGASKAPMADVAMAVLGQGGFVALAIIALFSTANTVLIIQVATSRQIYGIAEIYRKLKWLAYVNPKRRTPSRAVWVTMLLMIGFLFLGGLKLLAEITNFAVFFTFIFVNIALISLRYRIPDAKRGFKVPINVGKFPVMPVFGIIFSLFMMANLDKVVIMGGLGLVALGLVVFEFVKSEKTV